MATITPITYYIVAGREIRDEASKIRDALADLGVKARIVDDVSNVEETLYTIIFLLDEESRSHAVRIACKALKSSLVVYTPNTIAGMLYIKDYLLSRGKGFHSVMVKDLDNLGRDIGSYIKGYRAAASASDLKVLLFGMDYEKRVLDALNELIEPDYYVLSWDDASAMIDEGVEYSSLYIDTYLAAYFDVKGKDEAKLAKSLGLYLAIKSVLDSEGANAVLLDCNHIYDSKGFTAWITLNLLLDEGIPAACVDSPQSLLAHAVSLALTGKPAWESYSLKVEGEDVLLKGRLAPTLLFKEVSLVDRGSYYELAGKIKEGEYTLVSISIRRRQFSIGLVNATQNTDTEAIVRVRRVSIEDLLSDDIYLIPVKDVHVAKIAFEGLGLTHIN